MPVFVTVIVYVKVPGALIFITSTSLTTVKAGLCVIVVVAASSVGPDTSVVTTLAVFTRSSPISISSWVAAYVALYSQVSPTFNTPTSATSPLSKVAVPAKSSLKTTVVKSTLPVFVTVIV